MTGRLACAALADLVREFPTDAASADALAAGLRSCAPARVILAGDEYKTVMEQGPRETPVLAYSGAVGSALPGGMSATFLQHYELHASTGPDDLYVYWTGDRSTDAARTAQGQQHERMASLELTDVWHTAEEPQLARRLCAITVGLGTISDCFTRDRWTTSNDGGLPDELRGLRYYLNTIAMLTLDPARRDAGRRLAGEWTGTTGQLLDAIDDITAP